MWSDTSHRRLYLPHPRQNVQSWSHDFIKGVHGAPARELTSVENTRNTTTKRKVTAMPATMWSSKGLSKRVWQYPFSRVVLHSNRFLIFHTRPVSVLNNNCSPTYTTAADKIPNYQSYFICESKTASSRRRFDVGHYIKSTIGMPPVSRYVILRYPLESESLLFLSMLLRGSWKVLEICKTDLMTTS
jgi:hypothetical protein